MSGLGLATRLRFGAVILAAGASTRMGSPKLLLPWGPRSVLEHLVLTWRELQSAQIAVLCAAGNAPIQAELDRIRFPTRDRIINAAPERGMFSSVQCAARWENWNRELSHWCLILGDQPQIGLPTLTTLLKLAEEHPEGVCQLSHNGRPRHPVIVSKRVFSQLATATEPDLKQFLSGIAGQVRLRECDDPALNVDLDTPEDYERVRHRFGVPLSH